MQDGVAVDASLTPTSRQFFQKIAANLPPDHKTPSTETSRPESGGPSTDGSEKSGTSTAMVPAGTKFETIEVPLVFDGEFFDLLQSDVNNLDALQAEEEKNMTSEIVELGKEVAVVSKPSRFSKSDLARWRLIFELYLDAEVFFATHEQNHGTRSSQDALKQLQWFQSEVVKRRLADDFKLPASKTAFSRFLSLNSDLLKNLKFQEINKLAISKILKSKCARTMLADC